MKLCRSVDDVAVSVLILGNQWRPVIRITPPAGNRTIIEGRENGVPVTILTALSINTQGKERNV